MFNFILPIFSLFALYYHQANGAALTATTCLIQTERITCNGPTITDGSLLLLKDELHLRYNHMYFLELFISDSAVTRINSGTFADVQFENVYIQDNQHLTYIAPDAFTKQNTKSLLIINNPLLKNNSIYQLTNQLQVTEYVDFDFNALVEVPPYAFNDQLENNLPRQPVEKISNNQPTKATFKKLVLSNNKIEKISSNAFHLLESCNEIYLNQNRLKYVSTRGFNLANSRPNPTNLRIMLNQNQLTSNSFENDFISLKDNINLFVDLSKNNIIELKEGIFRPLLEKNIMIDFSSNPLNCQSIDWLQKDVKLMAKTKGIHC